ncbi:TetR/AcrR family transcriptional regulator [Frankia sp. AgB1.9]|uniref:TetR/AcrR family transcriptional regulator n=1 Tax=unclassified Frankia TaxID=2632575 RepID=UPI001932F479|nr:MULTISPECIES: TetR/AcrR family transcriptional regulator [unclassified Frankia]MBL7491025.1 TetR/AcrR family transcriptional regulator [Frankia sp. AgW1.1]MBL7548166.1 TetR/AcrR family transcriptional regulator [Frankia sp. AgB1.9]MBL7620392.1 TetR/AcrR family transcriptional regulator [Frankia sp. AgB1.8]
MTTPPGTRPRPPRRGGRPTREEAAQLDRDVREHALRLFLEHGYEGTSMDAIAQAAGTTKASLYARFPSKDAVFTSVFGWAMGRTDWPAPDPAPPAETDDLAGALTAIAQAAVRRALDPSMVRMSRIAIAQADRFPDLARRIQTTSGGGSPRQRQVADLLRRHAATGAIALTDDPDVLADLFVGMVSSAPARLASFGIRPDPVEAEQRIQAAVRLFVGALRP